MHFDAKNICIRSFNMQWNVAHNFTHVKYVLYLNKNKKFPRIINRSDF